MATLGDLQNKVLRLLDDIEGASYSDEAQLEAIEAAYIAILPWRPKAVLDSTTLTGDGTATSFVLPTNLYEVQAVIVQETGEVLPQAVFSPGSYHGEDVDPTNDWIEYPDGSLTFSKELSNGEIYELWYSAYWTPPTDMTDDSETLEPSDVVLTALAFYSAAYLLMPGAIGSAEIRQWNIEVDSGNPEHNPVRDAVTYLMNMFHQEMNRVPKFQRMQR
ncbi:MAG: phage adaptor protein [Candidatus Thorarchaeota archaeon]|jgi:hypothetical protein